MTTYTTRPQDTPTAAGEPQETRERISSMLLGALAVALVALGAWWYAQREATLEPAPQVTLLEPPATVGGTPASRNAAPRQADARAASARSGSRAAPVAVQRGARPLAGNPVPEYPRSALRNGLQGSVLLEIAIDPGGMPTDVRVVQRNGDRDREFDRAAIEAARQWRFEPALRGGKAVPSSVRLPVDFRRG